jgi:hypothetical protein
MRVKSTSTSSFSFVKNPSSTDVQRTFCFFRPIPEYHTKQFKPKQPSWDNHLTAYNTKKACELFHVFQLQLKK